MWLLLVAVGSGCLARRWRHGSSQRRGQLEQDEKHHEQEDEDGCPSEEQQVFDLGSSPGQDAGDGGAIAMVEFEEEMLKKKEKNALQQMDPVAVARRISTKKLFDGEEDHGHTSPKPPGTTKTTTTTVTTASSDPPQAAVETSRTQLEIESASAVPVVAAGKRAIEFSKHAMHEGDLAGIEVKRKRDSSELVAGQPQEQGLLSSFTCSFMDNPGLTDLWFAPREGDAARIRKFKTPSRQRSRGLGRRARYLRASPKPVSSMESCLSAQLHFDEDKRVSRSLFFQPFQEGRTPGLGEVEVLGTGTGSGLRRNSMHFPPFSRPFARKNFKKHFKAGDDPPQEALLFSFGVGIGVMHMVTTNNAEIERLRKCLAEAENLVQVLQRAADRGAVERSTGLDSAGSNLTTEQQGNMAELEAQLEAELELMQLNSNDSTEEESHFYFLDAEVVHSELNASGLPGVSDIDEDDKNHSHGEGNTTNWAVSPRELDRRLRMLIETRQEERIAQLEEDLQHAENQLHDTEMELQMWKDRVFRLTGMTLSTSGNKEENSFDRCKPGEQSPSEDICDEFLKSVFLSRQNSLRDQAGASSCSISECGESWQRQASGTTPENYLSGGAGMDIEPGGFQHNRNSSTDLEQERKTTPPWSYSSVFAVTHAGSTTPIQDVRSSKLFNTPRALRLRNGALVLDKIRYWENLARGSVKSEAHTPPAEEENATQGNDQSSPPVRFSCSDGSSRDDSSASDTEEGGQGHVLIKRIVEKSRKGSTLLKDVERMLAALDSE
ncbi:hypothetical protein SELMODRAFT_445751 [Selaginella moellendorffii]|uniref:Protein POLAR LOCALIZATION DURING ASYMMETRIC DIVISION AND REDISTRIBUTION n=1 Tax=Selaginella moellendorffii TaxID=88036 RepID=D8SL01_SELML|nr:hypothetical protein SELMODRAFT_445751 [Selaginella moellendorffii]